MQYHCVMSEDGLPLVVMGKEGSETTIGRALTKNDGEAIAEELNRAGTAALRDNILSAVTDAIEEVFET
jgi:hypothetical protein